MPPFWHLNAWGWVEVATEASHLLEGLCVYALAAARADPTGLRRTSGTSVSVPTVGLGLRVCPGACRSVPHSLLSLQEPRGNSNKKDQHQRECMCIDPETLHEQQVMDIAFTVQMGTAV